MPALTQRAAKISGELPHGTDIRALSLGREFSHPHVVEHALAHRRDGLRRLSHDSAPVGK